MRRPWERDPSLAHVPVGWRRVAATVRAVAEEHCLAVGVTVRWTSISHPFCPALSVVGAPAALAKLPERRARIQRLGWQLLERIAGRARDSCMACGSLEAPAHVELQANGTPFIALLCGDCEDAAPLDGDDFWFVIGRYDPLLHERDDELGPGWDGAEDGPEDTSEDRDDGDNAWPPGGGDGR